jgi:hypothetical protein
MFEYREPELRQTVFSVAIIKLYVTLLSLWFITTVTIFPSLFKNGSTYQISCYRCADSFSIWSNEFWNAQYNNTRVYRINSQEWYRHE